MTEEYKKNYWEVPKPAIRYAIPRRLNTWTLVKSKMNAKTTAATNIPITTKMDKGAMAIPHIASVDAISKSSTDDPMSHRLGVEDPRCLRSRFK
jgi:hypothetical protein